MLWVLLVSVLYITPGSNENAMTATQVFHNIRDKKTCVEAGNEAVEQVQKTKSNYVIHITWSCVKAGATGASRFIDPKENQ